MICRFGLVQKHIQYYTYTLRVKTQLLLKNTRYRYKSVYGAVGFTPESNGQGSNIKMHIFCVFNIDHY